jgi:hypothetical protein
MSIYKNSLALLDEFLSETSPSEVAKLINKHKNSGIEGPLYNEYLYSLQESFSSINWFSESEKVQSIDISDCGVLYQLKDNDVPYIPPPNNSKNIYNKKDSIDIESFFLV